MITISLRKLVLLSQTIIFIYYTTCILNIYFEIFEQTYISVYRSNRRDKSDGATEGNVLHINIKKQGIATFVVGREISTRAVYLLIDLYPVERSWSGLLG